MTIDERIEKLTERHEALAQFAELLAHTVQQQGENIDKILTITENQTSHIEAILHAVDSHERPLQHLECEN
jgi:hypothetical protein